MPLSPKMFLAIKTLIQQLTVSLRWSFSPSWTWPTGHRKSLWMVVKKINSIRLSWKLQNLNRKVNWREEKQLSQFLFEYQGKGRRSTYKLWAMFHQCSPIPLELSSELISSTIKPWKKLTKLWVLRQELFLWQNHQLPWTKLSSAKK